MIISPRQGSTVCLLFILLASLTSVARAQSRSPQHFLFDVRVRHSSIFQSKLEQGQKTVNFDSDLGFRSDWSSELRALWKITPGNRLRFDYKPLENSGEKVTERDLQINETVFPAGSRVSYLIGIEELRFSYSYLFPVGGERFRIGPLLDVRRVSFDFSASAQRTNPDELLAASIETDVWAGTIGAEFDSTPTPQLNFYGFVNWIGGGPLDGTWEVELGLRYFLTPWLGINGGYVYSGLKIVIDDPEGFFRIQSNNIFFGATLGF